MLTVIELEHIDKKVLPNGVMVALCSLEAAILVRIQVRQHDCAPFPPYAHGPHPQIPDIQATVPSMSNVAVVLGFGQQV